MANDQTKDEAQHVRPHEADQLMGMDAGTTEGPGITAIMSMNKHKLALPSSWTLVLSVSIGPAIVSLALPCSMAPPLSLTPAPQAQSDVAALEDQLDDAQQDFCPAF